MTVQDKWNKAVRLRGSELFRLGVGVWDEAAQILREQKYTDEADHFSSGCRCSYCGVLAVPGKAKCPGCGGPY